MARQSKEPALDPQQAPDVYEHLAAVFRDVFNRDDIVVRPELTAADVVGWDSFKQVEIILALEDKFAVRIRPRDVADIRNVAELVAVVQRKRAAAGPG